MHENSLLEECILLIELKLNWGPSAQWTAYHFSKLSAEIHAKTGKTVSDSTLKRLFGKKDTSEKYTPQLYTRDAIAEYLGFNDWQQLERHIKNSVKPESEISSLRKSKYVYLIAALAPLIFVVFFIMWKQPIKETAWLKTNDTNRFVPYTAVFKYDISKVKDSVFIDFGNRTHISLPANRNTITEFYKNAGVYSVKIFTKNRILDSVVLKNYTRSWQGGYSPNDDYLKYIPLEDTSAFHQNGRLYTPFEKLNLNDPVYSAGFYTEYRFLNKFNVSLDSVQVNAMVKNPPQEGGKLCYDIELWLLGSKNNCRVRFVEPECYRYGQLKISEKEYNGRFDDLSPLARDLREWRNVGVKTGNFMAEFSLDGAPVIKESYKKSMGDLIGIYIRFYGTGSLKEVLVKNGSNKTVYRSNF